MEAKEFQSAKDFSMVCLCLRTTYYFFLYYVVQIFIMFLKGGSTRGIGGLCHNSEDPLQGSNSPSTTDHRCYSDSILRLARRLRRTGLLSILLVRVVLYYYCRHIFPLINGWSRCDWVVCWLRVKKENRASNGFHNYSEGILDCFLILNKKRLISTILVELEFIPFNRVVTIFDAASYTIQPTVHTSI